MKVLYKLLVMLLVVSMLTVSLASCDAVNKILGKDGGDGSTDAGDNSLQEGNTGTGNGNTNTGTGSGAGGTEEEELPPLVDYVSDVKLDLTSSRKRIETTVKNFIDGDTTHFNVPNSVSDTGVLKARYLGINTPESTGQIEPWGKKASSFTKSKLKDATSIILESNDDKWNPDSTGDRYLVWVWYKTADMTDYKNLNLEILQEGLSKASGFDEAYYGEVCRKIFNQSITYKLHVFSQEKDPDFYYGGAKSVTLKELKLNIDKYSGTKVAFEGVVAKADNETIYIEEYDEESGAYFGIQVFCGYGFSGMHMLAVGNRVRIAGSVQYYELGGYYQLAGITYDPFKPDSLENIKKISTGNSSAYTELDASDILSGKLTFEVTNTDEDGNETLSEKELDYGYVVLHSTASLKNLTVKSVYTTQSGSSKGALSITCVDENGNEIVVRTGVLIDTEKKQEVTDAYFPKGMTFDVKGVVDYFDGEYQLKALSLKDFTFE